jgi:hypothetical protein
MGPYREIGLQLKGAFDCIHLMMTEIMVETCSVNLNVTHSMCCVRRYNKHYRIIVSDEFPRHFGC